MIDSACRIAMIVTSLGHLPSLIDTGRTSRRCFTFLKKFRLSPGDPPQVASVDKAVPIAGRLLQEPPIYGLTRSQTSSILSPLDSSPSWCQVSPSSFKENV